MASDSSALWGTVTITGRYGYVPDLGLGVNTHVGNVHARLGVLAFGKVPLAIEADAQEPTGTFGQANRFSLRLDQGRLRGKLLGKDTRSAQLSARIDSLKDRLREERSSLAYWQAGRNLGGTETLEVPSAVPFGTPTLPESDLDTLAPTGSPGFPLSPTTEANDDAVKLKILQIQNRMDELRSGIADLERERTALDRYATSTGVVAHGPLVPLRWIKRLSIGLFIPQLPEPIAGGVPVTGQEVGIGNRKFSLYLARGYARSVLLTTPERPSFLQSLTASLALPSKAERDRSSEVYMVRGGFGEMEGDHVHLIAVLGHGRDPWGSSVPIESIEARNAVLGIDAVKKFGKLLDLHLTGARSHTELGTPFTTNAANSDEPGAQASDPYAGLAALRFRSKKGGTNMRGELLYQDERYKSFLFWGLARGVRMRFSGTHMIAKPVRLVWRIEHGQRPSAGLIGDRLLGSVGTDWRITSRMTLRAAWSRSEQRTGLLEVGYHTAGMEQRLLSFDMRKRIGNSEWTSMVQLARTEWSTSEAGDGHGSTTVTAFITGQCSPRLSMEVNALSFDQPDSLSTGWTRGTRAGVALRVKTTHWGTWALGGDHTWPAGLCGAAVCTQFAILSQYTVGCGYLIRKGVENFRDLYLADRNRTVSLVSISLTRSF